MSASFSKVWKPLTSEVSFSEGFRFVLESRDGLTSWKIEPQTAADLLGKALGGTTKEFDDQPLTKWVVHVTGADMAFHVEAENYEHTLDGTRIVFHSGGEIVAEFPASAVFAILKLKESN